MIFVIGVDLVGKTTYIKKNFIRKPYFHSTVPTQKNKQQYYEYWENIIKNADKDTVFDRAFYCELPYSTILKTKPLLDIEMINKLEMQIIKKDYKSKVIFLKATKDILYKRYDSRGDELIEKEQLIPIQMLYEEMLKYFMLKIEVKEINGKWPYRSEWYAK